jgi:thymidylate synthase
MGAPCLNYVAVQLDADTKTMGLLAVYRNHDFFERAYGNYWGLCNLLRFMAKETNFNPGVLTCVSSHAYVDKNKTEFKSFVQSLS